MIFDNIKINFKSAPRSGSTFILQILKELFDVQSIGHNYSNDCNVVCIRNFVDASFSHYRVQKDLDNEFKINDPDELQILFHDYRRWGYIDMIFRFIEDSEQRNKKILFLIYEDITINKANIIENDYAKIFDTLEAFFNIRIEKNIRQKIKNKVNLKNNKKIQNYHDNFFTWDKQTLIHGKHINTGKHEIFKNHSGNKDIINRCLESQAQKDYEDCIKRIKRLQYV